jgi:hypothetical protein
MQEPVVPFSFLRAKPIGVMQMVDQGEQDDKIIAVHADDPEFKGFEDISQLPPHRLAEIKRSGSACVPAAVHRPLLQMHGCWRWAACASGAGAAAGPT